MKKFLLLNNLIDKNNNYHKKYKRKNNVSSYVNEYWNLEQSVGDEIAKFIILILRDFIYPWYNLVSSNDDFILCTEEFLANALSILITRGRIGLNPVIFFGDKVCYSIQLTLMKLREVITKLKQKPEFSNINPTMTKEWELYQMTIAEEFRTMGYLHPAFNWDDNQTNSNNNNNNTNNTANNSNNNANNNANSNNNNSTSNFDIPMEEFFSSERLKTCELNYARFIGMKLIKQLMMSSEDYNCRLIRFLGIELLSNTVLYSVLSMITPLNVNIWIDMGIGFIPTLSESVLTPVNNEENNSENIVVNDQNKTETNNNISNNNNNNNNNNIESKSPINPTISSTSPTSPSTLLQTNLHHDTLHHEFIEHYVGVVGLETVSSSCSLSTQDAAAAIVYREGCQLISNNNDNNNSDKSDIKDDEDDKDDLSILKNIDYSNDCGKFIVRKCEFDPFNLNIYCISYIRQLKYHNQNQQQDQDQQQNNTDNNNNSINNKWFINEHLPNEPEILNQGNNLKKIFEDSKHLNIPLVLSDNIVGHIFLFVRKITYGKSSFINVTENQCICIGATHLTDIHHLLQSSSSNLLSKSSFSVNQKLEWNNFDEMIDDIFSTNITKNNNNNNNNNNSNIDKKKSFDSPSIQNNYQDNENNNENNENNKNMNHDDSDNDKMNTNDNDNCNELNDSRTRQETFIPLEESFLREQHKLIHLFELQGSIDEFSSGANESQIKINSHDTTKLKSFRRFITALRDVITDGIHYNWQDDIKNISEIDDIDLTFNWLLNVITKRYFTSALYLNCNNNNDTNNISDNTCDNNVSSSKSTGDLNLMIWSAFVIARCQTNEKDWIDVINNQCIPTIENPCCLLCGDRKCYLLAESSVRNYPLNQEEKQFLKELKHESLMNQFNSPDTTINHFEFIVDLLYISGAYGFLHSITQILIILLSPSNIIVGNEHLCNIVRQRLNISNHWLYKIQNCWVENSLLKSPKDSLQMLKLLEPLDQISIYIPENNEIIIPQTPTKQTAQKSLGISKTVGLKFEKAFAAATSLFGETSTEDEHDNHHNNNNFHGTLPILQITHSQSSDRDKIESQHQQHQHQQHHNHHHHQSDDHQIESNTRISFLTESSRTLSTKGQMILTTLSNIEDSLANTASNLSNGAPSPIYLTFTSINSDIIEISRMRKQTADDKWDQKNSTSTKTSSIRFDDQLSSSPIESSSSLLLLDNTTDILTQGSNKYTHTVQKKFRRAEATFKLSILLRDRPTYTFLESRKIIIPREEILPPVYWIEINKYEKSNIMLYTLTIFRTQSGKCPKHNLEYNTQKLELFEVVQIKEDEKKIKDKNLNNLSKQQLLQQQGCICQSWEVQRRYSDFDDFHKHLKTQMGNDVFQRLKLPSKNILKVVQSQQFVEKRMKGLQDYLRSVLNLIPGSVEIETFIEAPYHILNPMNQLSSHIEYEEEKNHENIERLREESKSFSETITSSSLSTASRSISGVAEEEKDSRLHKKLFRMVTSVITTQKPFQEGSENIQNISQLNEGNNAGTGNINTGTESKKVSSSSTTIINSEEFGTSSSSTTTTTNTNTTTATSNTTVNSSDSQIDSSVFPVIEERLYALITELLEVDDMTIVKKRIFSLAIRSARLLFRTSVANMIKHQSKALSPDTQAGYFLKWIRELVWPNDVFYVAPPDYVPPEYSTIRKSNIERIVNFLPSALDTYLGENQGYKLLEKIYTLLDNPYILKSLVYMLVDSILIEIFPEFSEKLSGIDALQH